MTTTATRNAKSDQLRDSRLQMLPAGAVFVPATNAASGVFTYENSHGQPCACGYRGRAKKPVFIYRFPDAQKRDEYAARWLAEVNASIAEQDAFKAAERAPHSLAVGDILYTCWGYEQTNIDFYEIVAVRGAVVDMIELAQERKSHGLDMQGTCMPVAGKHIGELMKGKRPTGRNSVRMTSYSSARPWDGRALSWSSYA